MANKFGDFGLSCGGDVSSVGWCLDGCRGLRLGGGFGLGVLYRAGRRYCDEKGMDEQRMGGGGSTTDAALHVGWGLQLGLLSMQANW